MTRPSNARNLFRALFFAPLFALTAFLIASSMQIYSASAQDAWTFLPYTSAKAQIEYPEEMIVRVNTSDVEINVIPTITVNDLRANPDPSSGPTGDLTLPEAIMAINNTGSGYVVLFDLPPLEVINLEYTLQLLVNQTTIDGDSNGDNIPDVAIQGPNDASWIELYSANNVIRKLITRGIAIVGTSAEENLITGCYIGLDADGETLFANGKDVNGIEIEQGAHHNTIEDNLIAGNDETLVVGRYSGGVVITTGAHDNIIRNNDFGLSLLRESRPNGYGVYIDTGAYNNIIGGDRGNVSVCEGPCNLIANSLENGVSISGTNTAGNLIQGNYIGVYAFGAVANRASGVVIRNGAHENTIGGLRPEVDCKGVCNFIAGNDGSGVSIEGAETHSNQVQGNYIGLIMTQIAPNLLHGVEIHDGAHDNLIGGEHDSERCDGPCNVISANGDSGVIIYGPGSDANSVLGNHIGVNEENSLILANLRYGVLIALDAQNNKIGGEWEPTESGKCRGGCNVIRGNERNGVAVAGLNTVNNSIRGNLIYENGITDSTDYLDIDLHEDDTFGFTINSLSPNRVGPNHLVNAPLNLAADFDGTNTTITGRYVAPVDLTQVKIDIYARPEASDTYGGQVYVGHTTVDENNEFELVVEGELRFEFVSATATDGEGNTSEFSLNTPIVFFPGIGGSRLGDFQANEELWPGSLLFWRDLSLRPQDVQGTNIQAAGVFDFAYADFLQLMQQDKAYRLYTPYVNPSDRTEEGCELESQRGAAPNFFVYTYDWRQDIGIQTTLIQDYIKCVQKFFPGSEVNFLTHSSGGLVARRYILERPADHNVRRMVTMVAPWLGTPRMIYVLDTGAFILEGLEDENLRYSIESFPAAHQLLPSRTWFDLGAPPPLTEGVDTDFNHNGIRGEEFATYDQMMAALTAAYPEFPIQANAELLHDYEGEQGNVEFMGNDTTGVKYFHITSDQALPRTIFAVQVSTYSLCRIELVVISVCTPVSFYRLSKGTGDHSVATFSQSPWGFGTYEAAHGQVIEFSSPLPELDESLYGHTTIIENPQVNDRVIRLLAGSKPVGEPSHVAATTARAEVPPHNTLIVHGVQSIIVDDNLGNSTAPVGNSPFMGTVPSASVDALGKSSQMAVLATGVAYTIDLVGSGNSIFVEMLLGNNVTRTTRTRWIDVPIEVGAKAQLTVNAQGAAVLKLDADNNGSYETTINPSVIAQGTAANDDDGPQIVVQASAVNTPTFAITVEAQDAASAVKQIRYSFNGSEFQEYEGPIEHLFATAQEAFYVLAEDTQGNRTLQHWSPSELPRAVPMAFYLPHVMLPKPFAAGATERISKQFANTLGGNHDSRDAALSADGRFVAFASFSEAIIFNDSNFDSDIFVYDRTNGANGDVQRVSVASDGTQANGYSSRPTLSADGRFVAFSSLATNLVANDTNNQYDIFVHDRENGETQRVSVVTGGAQAGGGIYAAISGDGRFVAFDASATNLVASDTNEQSDIFIHDQQTGETSRVSVATNGAQSNGSSTNPTLSTTGRFVAFESTATNLAAGDSPQFQDIFIRDRQSGETTLVSKGLGGASANGASSDASISGDGRLVAFVSNASNLVQGDTNGVADIFLYNRATGQIKRVSQTASGAQADGMSIEPSISPDGEVVAYSSYATNLVAGDSNNQQDIFLWKAQTNEVILVSIRTFGNLSNEHSTNPAVANRGTVTAFTSSADNLVPSDTNFSNDIFVNVREP